MAVKWHPDKHSSEGDEERAAAEEKFKEVAEAYDVLSDPSKRALFDRHGASGLHPLGRNQDIDVSGRGREGKDGILTGLWRHLHIVDRGTRALRHAGHGRGLRAPAPGLGPEDGELAYAEAEQ